MSHAYMSSRAAFVAKAKAKADAKNAKADTAKPKRKPRRNKRRNRRPVPTTRMVLVVGFATTRAKPAKRKAPKQAPPRLGASEFPRLPPPPPPLAPAPVALSPAMLLGLHHMAAGDAAAVALRASLHAASTVAAAAAAAERVVFLFGQFPKAKAAPPKKAAKPRAKPPACRAWKSHGRCRFGEHCRFAHGAKRVAPRAPRPAARHGRLAGRARLPQTTAARRVPRPGSPRRLASSRPTTCAARRPRR